MKKALITGITGQDGAYLTELLLEKGYEVHGIKRRSSLFNTHRIDQSVRPDEIYNLAAQSHVAVSFESPLYPRSPYAVAKLYAYWIAELGITLAWDGTGVDETGSVTHVQDPEPEQNQNDTLKPGDVIVRVDPRYYRPTEVETLLGDATKARENLGWSPRISFEDMVREMVRADLNEARRDALCVREGFKVCDFFE